MPTKVRLPFVGEFPGAIDDKGRISIPADYRHALPEENEGHIILTLGNLNYLNVLPRELYNEMYSQVRTDATNFATLDSLAVDALLAGKSAMRILDSQGRITVPQHLVRQAGVGRDVIFMGRWDHFLIWDAKAYETYMNTLKLNAGQAWQQLTERSHKA